MPFGFGDTYDPTFGLGNLRQKQIFDQFQVPGLMDAAPQNNPFGNLFQPSYSPQPQPQMAQESQVEPQLQQSAGPGGDDFYSSIKRIIDLTNQAYTPEHAATDKYNELLSQFPQHERPSLGRAFVAAGMGLGKGDHKDAEAVLHEPENRKLAEWKLKTEPYAKAADIERQSNVNERTLTGNVISAQAAAQKLLASEKQAQAKLDANEKIAARKAENDKQKNDLMLAKQNGFTFKVVGNKYIGSAPDGTTFDTGIDATNHTPIEVATITAGSRKDVANIGAASAANVAGIQGGTARDVADTNAASRQGVANINISGAQPDMYVIKQPDGSEKAFRYDRASKQMVPVIAGGEQAGSMTKPGTPSQMSQLTTSTRTMMEGASMLLPHVTDLGKQAADLEKRGLFGPIMSRIRGYAAKLGTTGDPDAVQKSFEEFETAIANDPIINQSNDAAVGRFVANLGLMASGVGRVHGGARGGGSIQMVNYMKSLLNADSTLNMFNGRLSTIDDYLKGYAVGPGGAVISKPKDALDNALDNIFGVKK